MAKRNSKTKTREQVLRVLEYSKKREKSPLLVINCENLNPEDTTLIFEIQNLLSGLERLHMPVIFLINSSADPVIDILRLHNCDRFMAVKATKDFKAQIYRAANFYLSLTSTPNDIASLKNACMYSTVPIIHEALKGFKDYNPIAENGNSFTFKNINAWEIYAALVRALETFRFPYDWQNIIKEVHGTINVLI